MSKIRIYVELKDLGDTVEVRDKAAVHKIKDVLRLKKGDSVYTFDGVGGEYLYKISRIGRSVFILDKEKYSKRKILPEDKIILGFPLIKEEKIDFILQKATELGVMGFLPFVCQRSLKIKLSVSKIRRWEKIVVEAVRQSGRLWIPRIHKVKSLDEITMKDYSLKFFASIKGRKLETVFNKGANDILIIIGPEGDFTSSEVNILKIKGFIPLRLSSNILRSETAAVFAVGLISYADES